jgi:hypothetical protein
MPRHPILLLFAFLAPIAAHADCNGPGVVIDQRSDAQYAADVENRRARCVVFVLAGPDQGLRLGWVEWHHEKPSGNVDSTRLGLYPAAGRANLAFGIVPRGMRAEPGAARLTVLLPTRFWLLVNTTRIGWQMRAGLIESPDADTVQKLFTDVGLNANLGIHAESLQSIRDLARNPPPIP